MPNLTLIKTSRSAEREAASTCGAEADNLDLETVYREHAPAVSRWAQRLSGPGIDPEDLVHDVFLVVQRRLPEWHGKAKLSTWLYEITIRVVQERRRALRRRRLLWPFGRGHG